MAGVPQGSMLTPPGASPREVCESVIPPATGVVPSVPSESIANMQSVVLAAAMAKTTVSSGPTAVTGGNAAVQDRGRRLAGTSTTGRATGLP
jgi:hypothetical protein